LVGVFLPVNEAERKLLFGKVADALALIKSHAPIRYERLKRDLQKLGVLGRPGTAAQYVPELAMCELYVNWICRADVTADTVAAAIIHEAEHARLLRLGIGYEPAQQARVERVCHRAERVFARRLPRGEDVAEQAEVGMQVHTHFYGRAARLRRDRRALQQLAASHITLRPLLWWYDIRTFRRLKDERRQRAAQQTDAADGRGASDAARS
jgi:hypothetical protein